MTIPGIEMESTDYIAQLLAPPPPTTPPSAAIPLTPIAIATFSSEGSNSMAARLKRTMTMKKIEYHLVVIML